jgi:hypothetical protein
MLEEMASIEENMT